MKIVPILVRLAQVSSEAVEELSDIVGDTASRYNPELNVRRWNAAKDTIAKHDEFNPNDVTAAITRRVFQHSYLVMATTIPTYSTTYKVIDTLGLAAAPAAGQVTFMTARSLKYVIESLKCSWASITWLDEAVTEEDYEGAKETLGEAVNTEWLTATNNEVGKPYQPPSVMANKSGTSYHSEVSN